MGNVKKNNDTDHQTLTEYAHVVKRIATHVISRLPANVQLDDLIQAGMIGLLEAKNNYDYSKGASFTTYASIRIRGSILDELRRGDWVPRSVYRNARVITEAISSVENETGKVARDTEVADKLNLDIDEYYKLAKSAQATRVVGFDDLGIKEDYLTSSDRSGVSEPYDHTEREDVKVRLVHNIKNLPERDQMVLNLYYVEELNLKEIGSVLGVSESRICQIHGQALLRLKKSFLQIKSKE